MWLETIEFCYWHTGCAVCGTGSGGVRCHPDAPVGTTVRVTALDGMVFLVERAD